TDGAAGVLVSIKRFRQIGFVVEPFVGVELFVPPEVVGASMELVRAVLDRYVKLATGSDAVFGVIVGRQYLHFSDSVQARRHFAGCAQAPSVLGHNPVQSYDKLAGTAVDCWAARLISRLLVG